MSFFFRIKTTSPRNRSQQKILDAGCRGNGKAKTGVSLLCHFFTFASFLKSKRSRKVKDGSCCFLPCLYVYFCSAIIGRLPFAFEADFSFALISEHTQSLTKDHLKSQRFFFSLLFFFFKSNRNHLQRRPNPHHPSIQPFVVVVVAEAFVATPWHNYCDQ